MVECSDGRIPVDTGFIVYNELTYPNLVAMFEFLGVATKDSDMSFAVSMDHGAIEYCGSGLGGLFAQKRNAVRPAFWRMFADLVRFYRNAKAEARDVSNLTLDQYLDQGRYSQAFRDLHLYPMAAAIWSTPQARSVIIGGSVHPLLPKSSIARTGRASTLAHCRWRQR